MLYIKHVTAGVLLDDYTKAKYMLTVESAHLNFVFALIFKYWRVYKIINDYKARAFRAYDAPDADPDHYVQLSISDIRGGTCLAPEVDPCLAQE